MGYIGLKNNQNRINAFQRGAECVYDVAVLRAFLQVLSPEDALQALRHIGAALHPGGRLYIVGRILDDARLSPVDTVGFNLVFLNIFDDGRAYTEGEHRTWLTALGFAEIERVPLPEGAFAPR